MAQRRCKPQRLEWALLLGAPRAREGGARRDRLTAASVRRREERASVSSEEAQLQRRPHMAKTRRRTLLGRVRQARDQSEDRREGCRQAPPHQVRSRAANEG